MNAEWLTAALVITVLTPAFGHFEAVCPLWTRIARWFAYLAVTGLLGVTIGRPYTFVWLLGLPAVGATFHLWWCVRNGINPLTAEPRDRYEQPRAARRRPREGQGLTSGSMADILAAPLGRGHGPSLGLGFRRTRSVQPASTDTRRPSVRCLRPSGV
jgi:hypothetical protein